MKAKKRDIDKNGTGFVTVEPNEGEDLWHIYNLVCVGDQIRCSTIRRIVKENTSGSSGKDATQRKKITLTIQVEKIDFDPANATLRLTGPNVQESEYVKLGAYHTISVELHQNITIIKENWDAVALQVLEESCDISKRAEIGAVMIEEGLANLYLVTQQMTVDRGTVNKSIPKKKKQSSSGYEKALEKFFENTYNCVKEKIDLNTVKCLVVAGPGFTKDQFVKFLNQRAVILEDKTIVGNKSKIILANASSAHKLSLKEVMMDKIIQDKLSNTKAAREVKVLQKFFDVLQSEPDKAAYGYNTVSAACDQNGIESLLISDNLFRANEVDTRKKYVALVQKVKDSGGEVNIFSSLHVTGSQLAKLTGVAALLRFPMPHLESVKLDGPDRKSVV